MKCDIYIVKSWHYGSTHQDDNTLNNISVAGQQKNIEERNSNEH